MRRPSYPGSGGTAGGPGKPGPVFTRPGFPKNVDANYGILGIEAAAAGADNTTPLLTECVRTTPQNYSGIREAAGYGVVFAAAAALFATAPQPVSASQYEVGTHQTAMANGQSPGFVKQTNPLLIPATASVVVVRQVKAAPEQIDSGYTLLWGQQPATADPIIGRTDSIPPQQVDSGSADLWGPTPQGIDKPSAKTLQAAPQQVDSGDARFSRYLPVSAVVPDVRPPITLISAPQQVDSGQADTWGPVPHGIDKPPPKTLQVGPEQIDSGQSWWFKYPPITVAATDIAIARTGIWSPEQTNSGMANTWGLSVEGAQGTDIAVARTLVSAPQQGDSGYVTKIGELVQPSVAGTDTLISITRVSAPEQVSSGYAITWRQQPADLIDIFRFFEASQDSTEQWGGRVWGTAVPAVVASDRPTLKTLVSAPEQIDSASAQVWGTDVAAPLGTDTAIAVTRASSEPFYEPVQYGLAFKPNADLIPPPVVVPDETPVHHRGGYKYRPHKGYEEAKKYDKRVRKQLEKVLDDIPAIYRELVYGPDPIAEKAAEVVKPFVEGKKESIPAVQAVDWRELENDSARIGALISLWVQLQKQREIDADDEDWMMMGD